MNISEVVETPEGTVTYKTTLNQEQVSSMVKWFITTLVMSGAARIIEESKVTKGTDTLQ
jgi:hypothetical protein